jgi:hypothetical protein
MTSPGTSNQDKFVKVLTQELHQWHSSSSDVALFVVGLLLLAAVIGGTCLALWIFRGGWSRLMAQAKP